MSGEGAVGGGATGVNRSVADQVNVRADVQLVDLFKKQSLDVSEARWLSRTQGEAPPRCRSFQMNRILTGKESTEAGADPTVL